MKFKGKEILVASLIGVFLLTFMGYHFLISPALTRQESLRKHMAQRQSDLLKMYELKARWEELKRGREEAEKALSLRGKNFTLLSFLEGISREAKISDKIRYMKPISFPESSGGLKQEGMEISLEEVDLEQLVTYLYQIEYSGKMLNVKRIKVQREERRDGKSLLKATLQVNTHMHDRIAASSLPDR
jgi:type II secretory pathway component PulM